MSARKWVWSAVLAGSLCGAISGVGAVLFLQRNHPQVPQVNQKQSRPQEAQAWQSGAFVAAAVQRAAAASIAQAEATKSASPVSPAAMSSAVAGPLIRGRELFLVQLAKHEAAPRSLEWSRATEAALQTQVSELATNRALQPERLTIDCRTSSCSVHAEWKNRADAVAQYQAMLSIDAPGCVRSVTVEDAENEGSLGRATLLLSCPAGE